VQQLTAAFSFLAFVFFDIDYFAVSAMQKRADDKQSYIVTRVKEKENACE
jgi:hypothetical protein